jgi:hypothetical protein
VRTPKSLDVKRGRNFAIAKICDAFYGQVDLIVSFYNCLLIKPEADGQKIEDWAVFLITEGALS